MIATHQRDAIGALREEMLNARPRKDVFLPLMKATFSLRHHYILRDAISVSDILKEYPTLKYPIVVSSDYFLA